MSDIIRTLFWLLLVILGSGILGWLLRRWWREGFACGPNGARMGGHGGGGGDASVERAAFAKLETDHTAALRERDALKGEIEGWRRKSAELEGLRAKALAHDSVKTDLDAARARFAAIEAERDDLSARLKKGTGGDTALRADLEATRARLAVAESDRDAISLRLKGADAGLRADLDSARARIAELEARPAAAPASLAALDSDSDLRLELAAARARLKDLESAAPRVETRYVQADDSALRAEVASLRGELDAARGEAKGLRLKMWSPGADAEAVEAAGAAHGEAVALRAEADARLEAAQARIAELESAIGAPAGSLHDMDGDGDIDADDAAALRAKLRAARDESRRLKLKFWSAPGAAGGAAAAGAAGLGALALAGSAGSGSASAASVREVEVIKEAPVEVVREVYRDVPVETIRDVEVVRYVASDDSALRAEVESLKGQLESARGEAKGLRLKLFSPGADAGAVEAAGAAHSEAVSAKAEADAKLKAAHARIAELEGAISAPAGEDVDGDGDIDADDAAALRAKLRAAREQARRLRVKFWAAPGAVSGEAAAPAALMGAGDSGGSVREVEVIKEVPVEVVREIYRDVPVETIRDVEVVRYVPNAADAALKADLAAAQARIADLEGAASAGASAPAASLAALDAGASSAELDEAREEARRLRLRLWSLESAPAAAPAPQAREVVKEVVKEVPVEVVREIEVVRYVENPADETLRAELDAARAMIGDLEIRLDGEAETARMRFAELESAPAKVEIREVPVEVVREVEVEVVREVPVEVVKEVVKEVPIEVIREVENAADAGLRAELAAARASLADLQRRHEAEASSARMRFAELEVAPPKVEIRHVENPVNAKLKADLDAAHATIRQMEGRLEADIEKARARIAALEHAPAKVEVKTVEVVKEVPVEVVKTVEVVKEVVREVENPLNASLQADLDAAREEARRLRLRLWSAQAAAPAATVEETTTVETVETRTVVSGGETVETTETRSGGTRGGFSSVTTSSSSSSSSSGGGYGLMSSGGGSGESSESAGLTSEEREALSLMQSGAGASIERPALLLKAPRAGQEPDDLKIIRGVGPKLEGLLNDNGVYYFDQLGAFTPRDVAWIDAQLHDFKGRIIRDRWVPQARELARLKREGRPLVLTAGGRATGGEEAAHISHDLSAIEAEALRLIDSGVDLGERRLSVALDRPSRGAPDDFKRIRGVAFRIEEALHEMGIYYFSQLAALTAEDAARLDQRLRLRGRLVRDRWIAQAAALSGGHGR